MKRFILWTCSLSVLFLFAMAILATTITMIVSATGDEKTVTASFGLDQ